MRNTFAPNAQRPAMPALATAKRRFLAAKALYTIAAVSYLAIICSSSSAYALSPDQAQVFDEGIGFYNTQVCGNSGTLVGNDNLQKIFNYFVSNGFTPEQAAGIIGNVVVESGGDPQIYQGDGKDHTYPPSITDMEGWGIVQWTPPSKITTYAESAGEQPNTLETQVEFLLKQLNGTATNSNEKTAGDKLKAVTTGVTVDGQEKSVAWHAAQVFLMYYERAADSAPDGKNAFNRGNLADQALARYGASAQAGGASGSSSSATTSASCGGIPAHCDSPLTTGDYATIKSTLMDRFKINLQGDQNTPWAIETYNTICTLAKAPTFFSKLTAAGPITVSLHTENECGGGHAGDNSGDGYNDAYGVAMKGYCANSKDFNRYLLTHELGHMYSFRNPSIYQEFDSQVWGHAPTLPTFNCQHDYDHLGEQGPYEGECWADMIGEYVIYFDLRGTVGGRPSGTSDFKQYPTQYSAYYNFARDNIFGGIAYTSF